MAKKMRVKLVKTMKCLPVYWKITRNLRNWLEESMNRMDNYFLLVSLLGVSFMQLVLAAFLVQK